MGPGGPRVGGSTLGGCQLGGCRWSAPSMVRRAGASRRVGVRVQHPCSEPGCSEPGWGAKPRLREAPVELRLPLRCQDPAPAAGREVKAHPHFSSPKKLAFLLPNVFQMGIQRKNTPKRRRSPAAPPRPWGQGLPHRAPPKSSVTQTGAEEHPSEDRQGWEQAAASLSCGTPNPAWHKTPSPRRDGWDSAWHGGGTPAPLALPPNQPLPRAPNRGDPSPASRGEPTEKTPTYIPYPSTPRAPASVRRGFIPRGKQNPSPSGDALGTHSSYRQTPPKPPAPNSRRDMNKQGTRDESGSKSNQVDSLQGE